MIEIRKIELSDIGACVAVLRSLPKWFGIEAAIVEYGRELRKLDGFVALDGDDLVGFVGLKRCGDQSVEVNVIGVLPDHRGKGIGTMLLASVEDSLSGDVKLLHMKTLAPSHPDTSYAETRAFWQARGFIPMDAHELWGEENPCLVMVKPRQVQPDEEGAVARGVRRGRMIPGPKCIIVSGRPGSGKTTLASELSRRLYLPMVSRDEIKEGYVNTFNVKHDQLPKDTNDRANDVFFETTLYLLKRNVSVVVEAAFQHRLWNLVVPRIREVAHPYIVICELDAEKSARRHLKRGLNDPNREFFHGDRRVSIYRQTGRFSAGGPYDAPDFEVPTLRVSTCDGYAPGIEEIMRFVGGVPNRTADRDD